MAPSSTPSRTNGNSRASSATSPSPSSSTNPPRSSAPPTKPSPPATSRAHLLRWAVFSSLLDPITPRFLSTTPAFFSRMLGHCPNRREMRRPQAKTSQPTPRTEREVTARLHTFLAPRSFHNVDQQNSYLRAEPNDEFQIT